MLKSSLIHHCLSAILLSSSISSAETVSVTFGNSTPPYAIESTATGLDVEIYRQALAYSGHELKPVFVPTARILMEFADGNVDAASAQLAPGCCEAFLGNVSVHFEDVIISLQASNISIKEPEDMLPYRVMSFYYALEHYEEWLGPVDTLGHYQAIANQTNQLKMLLAGRTDIVIGEIRVMGYLADRIAESEPQQIKTLKMTRFTNPWPVRPLFRSERLRDDFNAGLAQLKESGEYQEIVKKYSKLYESSWLVSE